MLVSCFSVLTGCLCEGVHHSQSVKPDLWDAESRSLLFLLYSIIPTCLLWIHLLIPLCCIWSFLLSLCTGLLSFPNWWGPIDNTIQFFSTLLPSTEQFLKQLFQLVHVYLSYLLDASGTDAVLLPTSLAGCFSSPQSQPELSRNAMPPINLERWYQDIMAAGEPQSCPPPLPAKSFSTRRQGQVNPSLFLAHWFMLFW